MTAMGRVLVVDDDPGVRKTLRFILATEGFDVQTVACGEDALLACSPIPPDIVLLDVSMPGWDGYQVCERMRDTVAAPDLAIVFLTGAVLTCSPELDPVVVRVSTAREPGKEAQNERQTTHPGPDHRQAS